MASLLNESELFEKLKEEYIKNGDSKETFFKCVEICSLYSIIERKFVLYRLNQLSSVDTKNEKLDFIVQFIASIMKKNVEYGFYIAVIEASLDK